MKRKPLFPRSRWQASCGVLLLVLVVLLGAADSFLAVSESEAHLFADAAGISSPSAVHPSEPVHFERTTVAKRPHSPMRLHPLRAKSANLCGAVSVAPPSVRSLLRDAPDGTVGGACHRSTGARAPPLA